MSVRLLNVKIERKIYKSEDNIYYLNNLISENVPSIRFAKHTINNIDCDYTTFLIVFETILRWKNTFLFFLILVVQQPD